LNAILDMQPDNGLESRIPLDSLGCYGNGELRWCVAQTQPQAEHWAATNLRRNGYQTYLPLYATLRRDRALPTLRHTVMAPLFSGYIFILHNNPTLWRPIRETPGILSVLTTASRIQWVPAGTVEAIQAGDDARRSVAADHAAWAPGTACTLATGPFAGHDAVVIGTRDGRTLVSVMVFGAMREVSVDADCLTARV
jgi:transcription antitermination factor NusG